MAENLYEGMFILDSGKFASDPDGSTNALIQIVEKAGGSIVAHRAWQDGKLAYPIEKQRKGLHYLVYFKMPSDGVAAVTRSCKLSDMILRQLMIRHTETLFDAMVSHLNPTEEVVEEEVESPAPAEAEAAAEAAPAEAATTEAAAKE